jgi:hypothetical protein
VLVVWGDPKVGEMHRNGLGALALHCAVVLSCSEQRLPLACGSVRAPVAVASGGHGCAALCCARLYDV